ncbi:MAG: FG-GAP-like repeat-containing protein [Verrucomicrobiota bacterium]
MAATLDWQPGPGCRSAFLPVPTGGKPGFSSLPPSVTGIAFTNSLPEQRHLTNQILLNGSGLAAGDVDGDGWCDLYFCRLNGPNRLYRNLGDWKFQDMTEFAGVACADITSTGAAFADLEGDNDLDLIVNSVGNGTHLFFNDGHGRFREAATILNEKKGGMSMALGDIDDDGFLDLYLANYRASALMDMPNARATFRTKDGKLVLDTINGRPVTDPDMMDRFVVGPQGNIEELGELDVLYRNVDGKNFVPISFTGGAFLDADGTALARPPFDWGLTVTFRDINHDGLPDIYVCNDFQTEDRFWINQGGGRFRLLPRLAQRKSSLFSMALDFADINRDGFDDFLVLDMLSRDHRQRMTQKQDSNPPLLRIGQIDDRPQYGLNTLFLNRGDFTFAEIAQLSGVQASEWSWSCLFLDVDLDGWEDLLISNGMERAARDLDVAERLKTMRAAKRMSDAEIFRARRIFPRLATANLAFRNRHDLTFEEVGEAWGFDWKGISNGMALADLDNDGDLDVVVNNLNAAAGVYRNDSSAPRIAVRLQGLPPNTRGIGARIKVTGGPAWLQSQEMICGGRYLACDDTVRVFAAGTPTNLLKIEVDWRSGHHSVIREALPNHVYEVEEAEAVEIPSPQSAIRNPQSQIPDSNPQPSTLNSQPLYEDVSHLIGHVHSDEPFDDFMRQPLLPNKLSQLGPGISWFDLNGDGWDDLIIGSGKGGQMAVYQNDGTGGFKKLDEAPFTQPITRDQTSVLGWCKAPGQRLLLAGSAHYEDGLVMGAAVRQYDVSSKSTDESLPAIDSSAGPLALGDVDGDGDLDLLVGGRVIPGKYPFPASSRLFRNDGGTLRVDSENKKVLEQAGLVSGAVFSDLDGDGDPDLILACEWGPLRIYRNEGGKLTEWNLLLRWPSSPSLNPQPSTLNPLTGWWNSVATGDFDGDGQMDIVAANWGRNTQYESHRSRPLHVYYGDFDGDGTVDLVEAHFEPALEKIAPQRQFDALVRAMPFLRERFSSHRAYSMADIEEILGSRMKSARVGQANWLESTLFLNRGDRFEPRVLPVEAQFAPAFGLCVGDCDGDGQEDIFLAQNFFAVQPETPRYDGGRGLWLKGDGQGGFMALPGQQSGVKVYGEQRGAAVGDYDGDGRLDLAVSQNGAATKLYRNVSARPGLRIRLVGPPANPLGVGATLRLLYGERRGPAREAHAGSGYWSQDSAVQVLGKAEQPTHVWVRWPGGKTSSAPLFVGAKEIEIDTQGKVTVRK